MRVNKSDVFAKLGKTFCYLKKKFMHSPRMDYYFSKNINHFYLTIKFEKIWILCIQSQLHWLYKKN